MRLAGSLITWTMNLGFNRHCLGFVIASEAKQSTPQEKPGTWIASAYRLAMTNLTSNDRFF